VGQPVQRVVDVENRVAVAVGLVHQVAGRVVEIALAQRGGERGLRDPAEGVIGKRRGVLVGVGDREQVVLGVVGVLRDIIGRVGDRGQPVGVVVGVAGDLVVLVGDRGSPPANVIAEADRRLVRIGDGGQPVTSIVSERVGLLAERRKSLESGATPFSRNPNLIPSQRI
jgi:hypothetical protein